MHLRGFHYLTFILVVKRILLLALISARTAAVGIRSGSHVVGRPGEKGHLAAAGRCVRESLFLSLRGSIGLGHRRCVCYPGSEGWTGNAYFSGVNYPVLGDNIIRWDRKPENPHKSADFAWTLVSWQSGIFEYTAFSIFFDRVGIAEGISTGLWLYRRLYFLRFWS